MKRILLLFASVLLAAQAIPEVEITAEPSHHLILQNSYVRVFYVDAPAHADTLMHWHRHDYVYVILGDAHVSNDVKGKPPVDVKLPDGATRFSPATFAHIARNLSAQPFRNVTIEYLQDEELRASSKETIARMDETRGLDILQGGTKEILFVNDGVRATEFELQPGGVVPRHHHTGPHLLVAVTDLDIRSDVSGTGPMSGPMPGHFKSGDVKWLPGGYTHTLTNVGKTPARFLTLEFH